MNQKHNPPTHHQEDELLCAGLPFAGNRSLTKEELTDLRKKRLRLLVAAMAWAVATPFWPLLGLGIGLLIRTVELAVTSSKSFSEVAIFLLAGGGLMGGVAVSILKAKDCFHYAAVLSRTMHTGSVRQFAGKFDYRFWNEDTLEQILEKLINKKLIEPDTTDSLDIETYPEDDYIYRLNQKDHLNDFFPIHLTKAAAVPVAAAHFRAPAEFQSETEESLVERRRLTTEEQTELRSYARQTLRRSLLYSPLVLWCFTGVAWSVSTKFLSWNVSSLLTVVVLVVTATALFWQTKKWVSAFKQDAENDWVLILESHPNNESETEIGHQSTVEFLIHAGYEWTIDGKPASWRKKTAK